MYKLANRLKAVGFTDDQTETIVEIQREASNETLQQAVHDFHLDNVATKCDMKELETAMRHEIELLRADTARQIAEKQSRPDMLDHWHWLPANHADYRRPAQNSAPDMIESNRIGRPANKRESSLRFRLSLRDGWPWLR